MDYQNYISDKKELLEVFHHYINDENSSEEDFITFIKKKQYQENSDEFKLVLHMINNASNNYHRYPTFLEKIEKIILLYSNYIKQSYTNCELFNIFENNKRILLFLIEHKIITIDDSIFQMILKKDKKQHYYLFYFTEDNPKCKEDDSKYFNEKRYISHKNYCYYFYPEIKEFLNEKQQSEIEEKIANEGENFEENRHVGENESYVCKLIRKDSIEDFIIYCNQKNLSLSSEINQSIFETNPLLLRNQTKLIEYATFFGSIQIFKYLLSNKIELTSSLWLYAIHSNNPEIIELLIDNNIKPENNDYIEVLRESIKCHHNNIANYIIMNLLPQNVEVNNANFIDNQTAFAFHYHNYEFIQNLNDFQFIFYYACLYDYFSIFKFLVEKESIILDAKVIQTLFIFLILLYSQFNIKKFFHKIHHFVLFQITFHYYFVNNISIEFFLNTIL